MSALLEDAPYSSRDDRAFLAEMQQLTQYHLDGCPSYAAIWRGWRVTDSIADLPFLHVELFKRMILRTSGDGAVHQRVLQSSATSGSGHSQVVLDRYSSTLQARSALAILGDYIGTKKRPLLILDDGLSMRGKGAVSARIAAAMSLRPLSSDLHFLLTDSGDPHSVKWDLIARLLSSAEEFLVYGFTYILWMAWAAGNMPQYVRHALRGKRIAFVHSGGWKKMEALQVPRAEFERELTRDLHPLSQVVDYYGMVEQVGVIYPRCQVGVRHVPVWADVIVRDPHTLEVLGHEPGQLQLMNLLAYGAPYHSVLSEDMGRLIPGECRCGRKGKRFELLGRLPHAVGRGCANV